MIGFNVLDVTEWTKASVYQYEILPASDAEMRSLIKAVCKVLNLCY